ncbi:hypothetical protein IRJ41_018109 [Triplophysa rosa]|uniref:Uncharacterized protein n=1 Tax=Triplophysa rosa TaxID=992332 RepID=A0A9W7WW69_TRIRA|nr:hypothetical protein IRJ41_018109 [Triplophysa rosa]
MPPSFQFHAPPACRPSRGCIICSEMLSGDSFRELLRVCRLNNINRTKSAVASDSASFGWFHWVSGVVEMLFPMSLCCVSSACIRGEGVSPMMKAVSRSCYS